MQTHLEVKHHWRKQEAEPSPSHATALGLGVLLVVSVKGRSDIHKSPYYSFRSIAG